LILDGSGAREGWVRSDLPSAGEVAVEPSLVGICGTDLGILRGERNDPAQILGHEGIGRVVAAGPGVEGFDLGRRVVFNPVAQDDQDDVLGHNVRGLLQQRVVFSAREVAIGRLVPADPGLPELCGPLVEPLGTVVYAQELAAQAGPPERVAIFGAGAIGLLHALYARQAGSSAIFLVASSARRLEWAVARGIVARTEAVLAGDDAAGAIRRSTGGRGVDAVFVCTPRPSATESLAQGLACVARGGVVDLVAGVPDDAAAVLHSVDVAAIRRANVCGAPRPGHVELVQTSDGKPVRLTGHRGTAPRHLRAAMALLRAAPDRYGLVVSHLVGFGWGAEALRALSTPRRVLFGIPRIKVVIDVRDPGRSVQSFPLAPPAPRRVRRRSASPIP
jgi:threonine dehydrogenase-like Zn-dependent dehydrogenase